MQVRFNKLWQLCAEHDMKISFFYSDNTSPFFVSRSTFYEMENGRPVSLEAVDKICSYFKCQPSDIMEIV